MRKTPLPVKMSPMGDLQDQLYCRRDNSHTNPGPTPRCCRAYHTNPRRWESLDPQGASSIRNYRYTARRVTNRRRCLPNETALPPVQVRAALIRIRVIHGREGAKESAGRIIICWIISLALSSKGKKNLGRDSHKA